MKIVGAVVVVVLALGALSTVMTGPQALLDLMPRRDERTIERPHCDQLWPDHQIAAAIDARPDLVQQLLTTGGGVTVAMSHPCAEEPNKAVITIGFRTDDEWDAITGILPNDGFGAPVEVVGR